MDRLRPILLVEDSPNDLELILSALEELHLANKVVIARDGQEALDYLFGRGAFQNGVRDVPMVVMLDIKMPKLDGIEVLRAVRNDPALAMLPIVMLTSSREERDIVESYRLGVNAFVTKPVAIEDFITAVRQLGLFWAVLNEPPPEPIPRSKEETPAPARRGQ